MRCEYDIFKLGQSRGKIWLMLKDIEPRPANNPILQGLHQSRLIYYRSTRGIDQKCATLHHRQALCIDKMARRVQKRHVYRDEVRLFEYIFGVCAKLGVKFFFKVFVALYIVVDHLAVKTMPHMMRDP